MPLTILPDSDVVSLLHSLDRDDICKIQVALANALHYYSSSTVDEEENGCCASNQPLRSSLKRKDGSTTLIMPATSDQGFGVKMVTLGAPEAASSSTGRSSISSLSNSLGSMSMSGATSPATPSSPGSGPAHPTYDIPKDLSVLGPSWTTRATCPRGSLTLMDALGSPRAFINAEELTAFRTALASTLLFKKRSNVHELLVFGAGKQAYWHIRIAMLLRGDEIHHLNIINRSFDNAQKCIINLFKHPPSGSAPLPHKPKIGIVTPQAKEYERHLKSMVRGANVIFSCTPSDRPLFPHSYLTNNNGRLKGRYLAAIGSYKPHMIELHPEIMKQAVAPHHHHHHHKHARQGGAVVVDSVESCLKEAGEIIQAGLGGNQVVELGELFMLKRDAEKKKLEGQMMMESDGVGFGNNMKRKGSDGSSSTSGSTGSGSTGSGSTGSSGHEGDGGLVDWLTKGNVVYKSVGIGLMDVVVGGEIVKIADSRGIGTRIENF